MYMCICLYVCHMYADAHRGQKRGQIHAVRITGSCEPPEVGA